MMLKHLKTQWHFSCFVNSIYSLSLCSDEALMGVSNGANSQPPCFSKLCGPLPKHKLWRRGGGGIFFDWLALQHICGVEFYIHQVLVYHVSGGTECILEKNKQQTSQLLPPFPIIPSPSPPLPLSLCIPFSGIASFWTVVGMADFHFHISWKLHAWLEHTELTNTLSS